MRNNDELIRKNSDSEYDDAIRIVRELYGDSLVDAVKIEFGPVSKTERVAEFCNKCMKIILDERKYSPKATYGSSDIKRTLIHEFFHASVYIKMVYDRYKINKKNHQKIVLDEFIRITSLSVCPCESKEDTYKDWLLIMQKKMNKSEHDNFCKMEESLAEIIAIIYGGDLLEKFNDIDLNGYFDSYLSEIRTIDVDKRVVKKIRKCK